MTTQTEHGQLICPIMTKFVAEACNKNSPLCVTNRCALWRWTTGPSQLSDWVSAEHGRQLEANGWIFSANNGMNHFQYKRPYPPGERPGGCAITEKLK
jgi:hypothetical protein